MTQPVESVRTLAGKRVTLSFYAKADQPKNIALELTQFYGTGGSPSASVTGIGVNTVNLTPTWKKFTYTIDIPSISGKTLGTAKNDYLGLIFWFDAGSALNSRTNSLGQQSGTFDIAQVQLEEGDTATTFEERFFQETLAMCQRYYEKTFPYSQAVTNGPATGVAGAIIAPNQASPVAQWFMAVKKRTTPSITLYNFSATGTAGQWRNGSDSASSANAVSYAVSDGVVGVGNSDVQLTATTWYIHATADAEL